MSALDIVLAYHQAWKSGDVDAAMAYVSDDAVCRAPGEDLVGKRAYHAYLAGFAPNLTGVSEATALTDRDHVGLFYHPHTPVTTTAPAAELFTVRDGLIVENVLVFDRLSYAPAPAP